MVVHRLTVGQRRIAKERVDWKRFADNGSAVLVNLATKNCDGRCGSVMFLGDVAFRTLTTEGDVVYLCQSCASTFIKQRCESNFEAQEVRG